MDGSRGRKTRSKRHPPMPDRALAERFDCVDPTLDGGPARLAATSSRQHMAGDVPPGVTAIDLGDLGRRGRRYVAVAKPSSTMGRSSRAVREETQRIAVGE